MAKEKKKRRKSITDFFSSSKTTNESNNLTTATGEVVSSKSKIAKWMLSGTVISLTTIGITVPWALASCSIINRAPIDGNEVMYTIKIGDVEHTITYKDFEDRTNAYVSRDNQRIIDLTNSFNASVVKKLYDEEHQAYVKFKAIIDQKNKDLALNEAVGPTTYGYDVSQTSDKIAAEQGKNLQDAKKRFEATGDKDWIDKWTMELKTNPIYGFQDIKDGNTASLSEIENKAVEFMTTTALKKPALARFEAAQIVTDKWSAKDLTWEPKQDIKYTDPITNTEQTISKTEAKEFLVGSKGFLEENVNVVKDPKPTPNDPNKIAVFQTNSYIPQFRKPNALLKEILPNFFNSAVISSFDLAIKPGEKNFTAFTFDKSVLSNLFKITTNPANNLVPANKFAAILQLSKFQGAMLPQKSAGGNKQQNVEEQRAWDEQLITNLGGASTDQPPADGTTPANPGAQLGSSKFKIFNEHVAAGDNDAQRWSNIVALGSDANSFPAPKQQNQQKELLFTPKKVNPINIFLDLLLSITAVDGVIDFDNTGSKANEYAYLKPYWKEIAGDGKASSGIYNFVKLIKDSFNTAISSVTPPVPPAPPAPPVPFQQQQPPTGTADTILGQNRGLISVKDTLTPDYNTQLQNAVDALTDADLVWLGKLLAIVFMDEKAKVNNVTGIGLIESTTTPGTFHDNYNQTAGFWSVYQLSEQTFLQVNNDGMKVFTREVITSESNSTAKIDQMIVDDLTRTLDEKKANSLLYEVAKIYEKINTDEIINVSLINEKTNNKMENAWLFKYKLIKELFPNKNVGEFDPDGNFFNSLNDNEKQTVNESFDLFNTYLEVNLTSAFAKEENKAFEKITDLLNTNVQLNKYYEFTTIQDANKQTVLYWQLDPTKPYVHNTAGSTGNQIEEKYLGIANIESEFVNRYLTLVKANRGLIKK